MIKQLFKKFSIRSREKRAKLIWRYISINKSSKILDLGGGNGKYLHSIIQDKDIKDVTIADILVLLPRVVLIRVIRFFNLFWFKKTDPDWNLLTLNQMKELFPEAMIYKEKKWGVTKSLIAIYNK